jgi:hypothetical protein
LRHVAPFRLLRALTMAHDSFCVYRLPGHRALICCPHDQMPADGILLCMGSQHWCERFMREHRGLS